MNLVVLLTEYTEACRYYGIWTEGTEQCGPYWRRVWAEEARDQASALAGLYALDSAEYAAWRGQEDYWNGERARHLERAA